MFDRSSIDAETIARLAKILSRTQSAFDGEALAAARKAAQLLERKGLTYSELFSGLDNISGADLAEEVRRLKFQLAMEQKKADALASALRQERKLKARPKAGPLLESLEHLRVYLMGHFALKKHERELLARIEDPMPRSKEAHIVLICAQRYGVAFG